jgi:hypothetical protein
MERWVLCVLSLGILAPVARAEVDVRVSGERVDVSATAAPLAEVLDRLAQQTGMEIVYDGQPPQQRITLAFEGRSPAEAVQGILEGQGLNYALVSDPSGKGVQTLLLAGPVGKGSSPAATARRTAPVARRPVVRPGSSPEMMEPDFADMEEEAPFDDPDFLSEEPFDDPDSMEEEPPDGEAPAESPAGTPATSPLPPAAGPLPFPGGQPQVYPASPFTPQPFSPPESSSSGTAEPE